MPKLPTHNKTCHSKTLHPRNAHKHGYDFPNLILTLPVLADYTKINPHGNTTIDFADPEAVKTLNQALLAHHYKIRHWQIPDGALCPPIPGRVDYIHHVAELLNVALPDPEQANEKTHTGRTIKMLDVGTGASGIYALLASCIYGWQCVGSDINENSLANLNSIVTNNNKLSKKITLRLQKDKHKCFDGIIQAGEYFDISVCNPPFHASLEEAFKGTRRKLNNLHAQKYSAQTSTAKHKVIKPEQNFGGEGAELWCNGGEKLFLKKMIKESKTYATQCHWFTSLVSKSENLAPSIKLIKKLDAKQHKTIEMAQGNKITRIIAWCF